MKTTETRIKDKDGYLILPLEFVANQFSFKQILREGQFAIYGKKKEDWKNFTYEVIKILKHNGYSIGGSDYPPSEYYPSSESWGWLGFSYPTLEQAEIKFNQLKSERKIKKKV